MVSGQLSVVSCQWGLSGSPSIRPGLKPATFRRLSKYLIILLLSAFATVIFARKKRPTVNKAFKALNDPTRREILKLLQEKDLTAGEIADAFDISKPSISHHLDLLKQAGLVTAEKQGQFVLYSLNTTVIDDILGWLLTLKKDG